MNYIAVVRSHALYNIQIDAGTGSKDAPAWTDLAEREVYRAGRATSAEEGGLGREIRAR